jgi:hypothetical protein
VTMKEYVVVLMAGYEGERDLETFSNFDYACGYMREEFSEEEIEELHIAIALDIDGERTYDF